VRRIEPTTSARNGGLLLGIGRFLHEICWQLTSRSGALRQLQNNSLAQWAMSQQSLPLSQK